MSKEHSIEVTKDVSTLLDVLTKNINTIIEVCEEKKEEAVKQGEIINASVYVGMIQCAKAIKDTFQTNDK